MSKMTFEEILRSRVHRILKRMSKYQTATDSYSQLRREGYAFREGEEILGVYENSDAITDNIIVTTFGLLIFSNGDWKRIDYADMRKANAPTDHHTDKSVAKRTAENIELQLRSGEVVEFIVTGGTDRTRDVWSFLRFMDRVIGDYKSRHS
jgi:hypothetical protein